MYIRAQQILEAELAAIGAVSTFELSFVLLVYSNFVHYVRFSTCYL